VIKTNNITTGYFRTQKEAYAKQVRWEDFLAKLDYDMYKSDCANLGPMIGAIREDSLTLVDLKATSGNELKKGFNMTSLPKPS